MTREMTKFEVGDGACIRTGSDVRAYTVIAVTPSGKTVTLQRAKVTVTKPAAFRGDYVEYAFEPDPNGATRVVTYRKKDGIFRPKGNSGWWTSADKGYCEYYDPSF